MKNDWKPGLISEARRLAELFNLPDPTEVRLSPEAIAEGVRTAYRKEMFQSIAGSKFVVKEMKTVSNFPSYFYEEAWSNHQKKILLSYRLGILDFKTRFKAKYSDTKCIFKECNGEDSLEHAVEECEENPVERPKNRSLGEMLKFLEELHKIRMKEINTPLYYL